MTVMTEENAVRTAVFRLNRAGFPRGTRLLDVDTGGSPLVSIARNDFGLDAWGQDPEVEEERVYKGALLDIGFPTASFDVVMASRLEQAVDIFLQLHEIKRVLVDGGRFIVDWPRFFTEEGMAYREKAKVLWDEQELVRVLTNAGFLVEEQRYVDKDRFVVWAGAPRRERKRIMVPAGIGDAYWVMVKLPGFLEEHGITVEPSIVVQDSGGPKRTQPYIRNLPMVHDGGYKWMPTGTSLFQEAYNQDGRTVFPKPYADIDWFMAYNGVLRFGKSLEEVDPQWVPQWRPKLFYSKQAKAFRAKLEAGGPYLIAFFAEAGMYRNWLGQYSPDQIVATLKKIENTFGVRIVVIGAEWDRGLIGHDVVRTNPQWEDLIGQTSFDEMLGAIDGAWGVFGFPAGNTMMGAIRNVPTVLVWNAYFRQTFWKYAVPPDAPYMAVDTLDLTPDMVVQALRAARHKWRVLRGDE